MTRKYDINSNGLLPARWNVSQSPDWFLSEEIEDLSLYDINVTRSGKYVRLRVSMFCMIRIEYSTSTSKSTDRTQRFFSCGVSAETELPTIWLVRRLASCTNISQNQEKVFPVTKQVAKYQE